MALLQKFQQFIQQENLFSAKDKLLLALSGGIDSVVLCELCQQAGHDFVIAHCNFQLRGEESERDEAFVRNLAKKYGKEVLVRRFDTEQYAKEKKISIQVAARELRYEWFFSLVGSKKPEDGSQRSEAGSPYSPLAAHHLPHTAPDSRLQAPDYLLTAHHLDDNIETMLMNFFKGTGIKGLRGMLPKQDKLLRPLLFAKKDELKKFAEENQLSWVEDSSNQSDKYSRNYFRNQLIPFVRGIYPEAENNLANNLQRFRDIETFYEQSVQQHKKALLEYKGNEVHVPVLKLKKAVPLASIVYEIIKDYHFNASQANEVINLLDSETGKYVQSATHRIIKNRNWIIIAPVNTAEAGNILIEMPGILQFGAGILELQQLPGSPLSIPSSSNIACVDMKEIKFPLLLRKCKTGDYFYPLGMKKKKKLSRFFIDQKLSKTDKEKIWVIECNKKIVWVMGYRMDDRFKVVPSTTQVLRIELKSAKE